MHSESVDSSSVTLTHADMSAFSDDALSFLPQKPRLRDMLLIVLLGATFFFPLLGVRDFWYGSETRVAYAAREMRRTGDWVLPRDGDQVRLEKPPMAYWLAALASIPFDNDAQGMVFDEFTCRVPNALAGVAVMVLTYLLGCACVGRRAGGIAAILVGGMAIVWWQSRMAGIEMPHLAFNLGALYAWWKYHTRAHAGASRWLLLCYFLLACSFLEKGIGPLVVLLITSVFLVRRWRMGEAFSHPFHLWHHVTGLALLAVLILPWPVLVHRMQPDILSVWRHESAGRLEAFDHRASPFFFFIAVLADGAPWSWLGVMGVFVAMGGPQRHVAMNLLGGVTGLLAARLPAYLVHDAYREAWRDSAWAWVASWPVGVGLALTLMPIGWRVGGWVHARTLAWRMKGTIPDHVGAFLSTWALMVLLFFSLPESKNNHYVLLIYPVLAVLAGVVLVGAEGETSGICGRAVRGMAMLLCGVMLLGAGACFLLPGRLEQTRFAHYAVLEPAGWFVALTALVMACGLGWAVMHAQRSPRGMRATWGMVCATFFCGYMIYGYLHRDLNANKAPKAAALWMAPQVAKGDMVLAYGIHAETIIQYYLGYPLHPFAHVEEVVAGFHEQAIRAHADGTTFLLMPPAREVEARQALATAGISVEMLPGQPDFPEQLAWYRLSSR